MGTTSTVVPAECHFWKSTRDNKFAQTKIKTTKITEEIKVKKKQLQHLEACDDIMLQKTDCLMTPYQIGGVFISHSHEET